MRPATVLLAAPPSGRTRARFSVLSGADELALYGSNYAEAIAWLGEAMAGGDEAAIGGAEVTALTVGDGDRLFASLYAAIFGDLVELRQSCSACPQSFELAIPLDHLSGAWAPQPLETILPGGTRLRAVTLNDLIDIADGADGDLVRRTIAVRGKDDDAALDAAFETLNPASTDTIETNCAHCGARQLIAFDLPRFFLKCAERERGVLLREIHLLARTYGWGLGDILSLTRTQRHELVRQAISVTASDLRVRAA